MMTIPELLFALTWMAWYGAKTPKATILIGTTFGT